MFTACYLLVALGYRYGIERLKRATCAGGLSVWRVINRPVPLLNELLT